MGAIGYAAIVQSKHNEKFETFPSENIYDA